jgi:hypothetical protein
MKYQSEMCSLTNCPPSNCIQDQLTAYRFVYDPVCEKSFIPQGVKSPSRMNSSNHNMKCSLLGLSFFSSEEKAKARYASLKNKIKNINKTLGSHIAEGVLDSNDGHRTDICKKTGHFDFFENRNVNLISNFKIVFDLRSGA